MYATKQDLIDRYGFEELERYAWDAVADAVDDAKVTRAITDASEEVNLYIGGVTRLPLDTTPPALTRITADIARYQLQDDSPLDEARERYKQAVGALRDIAAGRAILFRAEAPPTGATVAALRDDTDRIFTRETLDQF